MSDEVTIEKDPGWMEDLTFNVDTNHSDIPEYIDSRKDEPPLKTDLLGDGLNVARLKMVKVTLRIKGMGTNIWIIYQKTGPS